MSPSRLGTALGTEHVVLRGLVRYATMRQWDLTCAARWPKLPDQTGELEMWLGETDNDSDSGNCIP